MTPEDREAYLQKKKQEAKRKLREIMKQKWADAKKVRQWNVEVSEICLPVIFCTVCAVYLSL